MSKNLPTGWVRTALGEICMPVGTIQPEATPDDKFTYFDIGGIDSASNRIIRTKIITGDEAPSRARRAVQVNDILFSTVRTYLNKIALVEMEYSNPVASTGFAVIRAAPGVSPEFLFFQILSPNFLQPLHALQTGTSYPAVREKDLLAQPVVLAPSSEQRRVVTRLKEALSRITAGEAITRRAIHRLQGYRTAVFRAALTGELTREWRKSRKSSQTGEELLKRIVGARRAEWEKAELRRLNAAGKKPENVKWKKRYREPEALQMANLPMLPSTWIYASVEQVGFVQLGRQRSPEHHHGRFMRPYLRVANVFEDRLDLSDVKRMNFTAAEFEVFRLQKNDILLNEGQSLELVGRPAMYRGEIPGACFQNTLIRFRASKPLEADFALIVFRGFLQSGRFQEIAKQSTNIAHLGADRFAKLEFPLPPVSEQKAIIREVERRLSAAEKLSKTLDCQLERAGAMRHSLFREAFAGRLVPQDPQDEPAELLLGRIRVARELEEKKPKVKRMPKLKSKLTHRPLLEVLREYKKPMTPEQLFRKAGFQPADADLFYRELASLRKVLRETKPSAGESKSWPHRARVLLEIKGR